jgi:hypothetical protein
MKFMKRAQIYKGRNVTFNPQTKRAYSYNWWRFVDLINGKLVFNRFYYSPTTSKHQSKLRGLLHDLNIAIDLEVWCGGGLQSDFAGLSSLRDAYEKQDFKRAKLIEKTFKVSFTNKELAKIYQDLEESLCDAFLSRSVKRQEKQDREFEKAAKWIADHAQENGLAIHDQDAGVVIQFNRKAE